VIVSAPSAASRLTVVACGTTNKITFRPWTEGSGWAGWQDLGGPFTYDAAIISGKPDQYTVYGVDTGQNVYRKSYIDGSGWESVLRGQFGHLRPRPRPHRHSTPHPRPERQDGRCCPDQRASRPSGHGISQQDR
jgi:hypothetical protein